VYKTIRQAEQRGLGCYIGFVGEVGYVRGHGYQVIWVKLH
jgi:hypothetical protein